METENKENSIFRGRMMVIIRFRITNFIERLLHTKPGGVTQVVMLNLIQPGKVGAIIMSTLQIGKLRHREETGPKSLSAKLGLRCIVAYLV